MAMSGAREGCTRVATMIGQLTQGGTEKQLYLFLAHCDRQRWSPIVYVSRGPLGRWEEPIHQLGIPIILLEGRAWERLWQFRRSCRALQVRRFFSWSAHTNVYGLALWGLGIYRVGSFRNEFAFELAGSYPWIRSWACLAGVDAIVCNSQETTAAVCRRAGDHQRVVYIPNSVESVERQGYHRLQWRRRLGLHDDEVFILGVGRLAPQKNFARFVQAIALVRRDAPVRAAIAGRDDGCLESLRQEVQRLGLDAETIRFIGPVPNAQELMCAADIFVLSSDREGMPNVVLEAMAVGVPCVCTRVGGVSDLITPGVDGLIVDRRPEALAAAIRLLAQDQALRQSMGARALKRIGNAFAPQTIAGQLWQVLE